jgi:hypothetical protein
VVVFIALFGIFLHADPAELIEKARPAEAIQWKEAILNAAAESARTALNWKFGLVTVELIFVFMIIFVYWIGTRQHWHGKWLEYRALAEMLRDLRFLAYLAEYGRIQRADIFETASAAWYLWYSRATARELGLPQGILDGTYQYALLTAVDRHVITDQLDYHRPNAHTLSRMNYWLQRLRDGCFMLTLAILFIFVLAWLSKFFWGSLEDFLHGIMHWVTFLAAFLPAAGAALAGIRETGDFHGFAHRSARTVTALENLGSDLARAKREVLLDDTNDILVRTAQVLTEDLAAWQSLYSAKRLNLPV